MSPEEQQELAELIGKIVDTKLEARAAKAALPVLNGFAFVTPVFSPSSNEPCEEVSPRLENALQQMQTALETVQSDQERAATELSALHEVIRELLRQQREKSVQPEPPQEANLRALSQFLMEERTQRAACEARLNELARTAVECLRQLDARIQHEDGESKHLLIELREGLVGQFSNKGLASIVPAPNDRFDPALHKSVNGSVVAGVIQQMVQPGYQWDNRPIYKAEVVVTPVQL